MNMRLREINEAPGHTDTGLMDKNQKLRKQKDLQNSGKQKEVQEIIK